jgi:hypothetical protein
MISEDGIKIVFSKMDCENVSFIQLTEDHLDMRSIEPLLPKVLYIRMATKVRQFSKLLNEN